MVAKKCTTASNMCPTGFCAAVGTCCLEYLECRVGVYAGGRVECPA